MRSLWPRNFYSGGPEDSKVTLWPNTSFFTKVLSSNYVNTPVILPAFHSVDLQVRQELYPVRSLHVYVDRTDPWRTTDQLFVCFSDRDKGSPVSKSRLAHWITEVITSSYASAHKVLPNPVKCHSTCSVATSWAALRGVPAHRNLLGGNLELTFHVLHVSIDLVLFRPQTAAQSSTGWRTTHKKERHLISLKLRIGIK